MASYNYVVSLGQICMFVHMLPVFIIIYKLSIDVFYDMQPGCWYNLRVDFLYTIHVYIRERAHVQVYSFCVCSLVGKRL